MGEQENIETLKSSPVKPSSPKKTEEFIRDLLSDEERADKRKGMASSSRKRHESEVRLLPRGCGFGADSCVGGERCVATSVGEEEDEGCFRI